ncbi:hypothetical protein Daus18300_013182 [Diaporthe australafricana]|uniref:C2H2-type domain-containing protein n=1 Tax=Diaporthe australafricana TaxID=127596 RepID=A0ABR3W034_9PEZI
MPYRIPGCDFCNVPRCKFCVVQDHTAGWRGKRQDLYTWRKDAALLGPIPAEPQLPQPPDLTKARATTTCTSPEPHHTHDTLSLREPLPTSRHQFVAPQSLNGQWGISTLPTSNPPIESGLSSLSLDQADTIDLFTDPFSSIAFNSEDVAGCASSSSLPTDTINRIFLTFNEWKAGVIYRTRGSNSPTTNGPTPSSEPNRSSGSSRSRKRTSDQGSTSKQSGSKRPKVSSDEKPPARKAERRLLACPFWKKDPIRHRDCFKGISRISYVKQHLRRSHQRPAYFCHRCGTQYRDEEEDLWIEHQLATERCEERIVELPDGITRAQQNGLTNYSDRSTDEADQWYVVWDYVFPDGRFPKPSSPYVNQDLSEEMSSFREFSHSQGWNALASDPNLWNVTLLLDEELLQRCLTRIHDNWLAKRSTTSQTSSEESPLALSNTSTPDETVPTYDATPVGHHLQGEDLMLPNDFTAGLDSNDYLLTFQDDNHYFTPSDFMITTSLATPQMLSNVPLPRSARGIEHGTHLTALDPTITSR